MNKLIKQAFTLIELLVVIAIIGILSGLIVVSMNGMTTKATIAKAQVFSNSLRNSLMMNMIAEWKFDELTTAIEGTPIQDSWGKNNGTLDTYTTTVDSSDKLKSGSDCVSGKCIKLDGSNDYVNCGSNSVLNLGVSDFSISVWIKNSGTGYQTIYSDGSINSAYIQGRISLRITDTSILQFSMENNYVVASLTDTLPLNDNVWHLVTATRKSANMKLYIDGALRMEKADASVLDLTNDLNAYIGTFWSTNTSTFIQNFNGSIDDIRIYNAALPASQIKEQYFAGLNNLFANDSIDKRKYSERINSIAKNE